MATDQYPQRNHNIPMSEGAVDAARQRLNPKMVPGNTVPAPSDGKGSRREVRPGEWVDDRVIVIGGPASPSEGTPPEPKHQDEKALPTFNPAKAYQVTLKKACVFAGRVLSPSMSFQMQGSVCLDPAVQPCIGDAVELGPTPVEPDVAPSQAKKRA